MVTQKEEQKEMAEQELLSCRDQVKQIMEVEDIPQATIARETGFSAATISQWLKDMYKGDSTAIENKLMLWLSTHSQRREIRSGLPQAPEYIRTPTSDRVWAALSYAHMAGDFAIVYGGAGMGKTITCRQYGKSNPNIWIATMTPDTASVGNCLDEIAEAVNVRNCLSSAPARLRREICKKIAGTGGLLVIDEAQHLSLNALEEIRSIHDATGIGLALIGNESVYARLTGGQGRAANFAQLFSRVGKRLRVNLPLAGDIDAIAKHFKLSGSKEVSMLMDLGRRPGAMRGLVKGLRLASIYANDEKTPLAATHIRAACRELGMEG